MPTQMAGFRRRFLAIDLDQISPEFLCHPLRFEQEISKAKITDLPAPKPMHRFEIKCLKDQQVKCHDQQACLLPLPIVANIGHLLVDLRDIQPTRRFFFLTTILFGARHGDGRFLPGRSKRISANCSRAKQLNWAAKS